MSNFLNRLLNRKPSTRYLFFAMLFFGILLRLFALKNWSFGFDQVQIIEAAARITEGDFTLIGPRTGPASLFTGPAIYYLTAVFYLLGFSYYALVATTIFIAALTGLTLYYLFKRYHSAQAGAAVLFLWAFSVFLIKNDQVTWNPNLSLLAASLLFLPILASSKQTLEKIDYLFIFFGNFLAYQAHFSGFLFLPLGLLFFLSQNSKQAIKAYLIGLFGFVISLLPTIVFDYRNNWLNVNGLFNFIFKLGSAETSDPYIYHLWKSFYTTFESFGGLVFANSGLPIQALFMIGLIIFLFYIYFFSFKNIKNNLEKIIPICWILISLLFLSFYSGDKPPYYFLLQIPAFIFIYLNLYNSFRDKFDIQVLIALFAILAIFNSSIVIFNSAPFSLSNSLEIKKYIQDKSAGQPIRDIKFHLPNGEYFGLEYLLADLKNSLSDSDVDGAMRVDWYLSYPAKVIFAEQTFGNVDVWSQAVEDNQNIYFSNDFRIQTPEEHYVYRDNYYIGKADENYLILNGNTRVANLEKYRLNSFINNISEIKLNNSKQWQIIDSRRAIYYYQQTESIFLLSSDVLDRIFYENFKIY